MDLCLKKDLGDLRTANHSILRLPGVVEHGMFTYMFTKELHCCILKLLGFASVKYFLSLIPSTLIWRTRRHFFKLPQNFQLKPSWIVTRYIIFFSYLFYLQLKKSMKQGNLQYWKMSLSLTCRRCHFMIK